MSRTVTRRPGTSPYSGSGLLLLVRSPVAAAGEPSGCRFMKNLHVSRRPCGVPGHTDDDTHGAMIETSATYPCYRPGPGPARPRCRDPDAETPILRHWALGDLREGEYGRAGQRGSGGGGRARGELRPARHP